VDVSFAVSSKACSFRWRLKSTYQVWRQAPPVGMGKSNDVVSHYFLVSCTSKHTASRPASKGVDALRTFIEKRDRALQLLCIRPRDVEIVEHGFCGPDTGRGAQTRRR
jgi:hypothetical protein